MRRCSGTGGRTKGNAEPGGKGSGDGSKKTLDTGDGEPQRQDRKPRPRPRLRLRPRPVPGPSGISTTSGTFSTTAGTLYTTTGPGPCPSNQTTYPRSGEDVVFSLPIGPRPSFVLKGQWVGRWDWCPSRDLLLLPVRVPSRSDPDSSSSHWPCTGTVVPTSLATPPRGLVSLGTPLAPVSWISGQENRPEGRTLTCVEP